MAIAIGEKMINPQTGHIIIMTAQGWTDAGSPQMQPRPQDADAMKNDYEAAQQAQWLAQKGAQFNQVQQGQGGNDVTQTGFMYHDVGIPHIAENINPVPMVAAAVNPRVGQMESISNQAWTHMRPTGSGPMRMPEIEGFQQAFPNVGNSPDTNKGINDRLQQDATYATQRLQFIDNFLRQNQGTYADANAAWLKGQQGNIQSSQLPPVQGQNQWGQPTSQGYNNAQMMPTQGQGYGGPTPGAQPMATAPQPQGPGQAAPPTQGWQILGVQ